MKIGAFWVALSMLVFSAFADQVQTRVTITSQPSGATIIIDGKDRGTTPTTLFDLEPGRHHLKYRLSGYVERDRFFNTDEGPFIEKNEVLQEELGLLLLKTDPAGCNIIIDGVSYGETPKLITSLAVKDTYGVKLRKAGYQDLSITIRFDGRKPLVREEKMVRSSGTIDITSEPVGAEVTVNGIVRGKTPLTVVDVPRGRAVVKFRLDGFAEEVRELSINAGDHQTLPIVMNGLPGTMHLTSNPEGARFYINGEPQGKGPIVLTGLRPGSYEVRAELDGYGTTSKQVIIDNGASAREEFKMSNVMGRLEVRTSPVGAQLILDGRPIGITRSDDAAAEMSDIFPIENILEGDHVLLVRKEGFQEVVRHPKIKSSKTSKANVRMKRIFTPDVEIEMARGTISGVLVSRDSNYIVIEVKAGITQSVPMSEVRKVNFLNVK